MIYRLKNIEGYNVDEIKNKASNKTHKFITYQYSISLIVGNIHVCSPVYFLKSNEVKKHTLRYNFISILFGWWSIPYGPSNTITSIKTNSNGGIDVTNDVILNLSEQSLDSKKVKIEQIYSYFKHPKKSTEKDFIKSLRQTKGLVSNQNIYLGQYTNTDDFSYTIGFENISIDSQKDLIKNLRKYFYEHVHIEVIQIDKENEFDQRLIELGKRLNY
ncbi:conserved protein of unknown function [Tenacibaculum sp. 190130A14a]|uniref:Uncharacterized protein n=1 Tax=Tenacibaculum polynesiense TaxID=3137857 RepID=A0ABP1EZ48_9FLAO